MNHRFRIGNCIRDRYTITDILLPEGGFGIIYKVREYTHPQQPFRVMKQLKKPTAVNLRITHLAPEEQERILNDYWESYVQQFEREAQALARLSETCTQIPKIIEQFNERVNEQDEHLFVQEFIDGYSLDQEIRLNGRRSERETKDLLIEILEILEHIQTEHVVVHGDIKPENIIRSTDTTRDKKLVLIDFGLVKEVIIPDEGVIIPQLVLGTEGYVAPEIINQEVYQVSFVSDIYAVGMIGLFAITGEDPSTYEGELANNWQNIATVSQNCDIFAENGLS